MPRPSQPTRVEPDPNTQDPSAPHAPQPHNDAQPNAAHAEPLPWNTRTFRPLAGLAALAIPGLGHAVLGLPKRGMFIALGVLGLLMMGVLIGGLDAVDSRYDRWWFFAQSLAGPVTLGIDSLHQMLRDDQQVIQGVGRMNELGMLAGALAGLMNLIAIIDAAFPPVRRRAEGAHL